jgi:predicted nucleic acid-binding protein
MLPPISRAAPVSWRASPKGIIAPSSTITGQSMLSYTCDGRMTRTRIMASTTPVKAAAAGSRPDAASTIPTANRAIGTATRLASKASLRSASGRQPRSAIAPDLIMAELCNGAWRLIRRGELRTEQLAIIASGVADAFTTLHSSASLAARATAIALELNHPVYDCFYLALSETRNARLVTIWR